MTLMKIGMSAGRQFIGQSPDAQNIMKIGQTSGRVLQKIGSNVKFNIGEGLSSFSPFEKTGMKIAGQVYRAIDEREDEVDGFTYLAVLSSDELAVYWNNEIQHLITGIRGTATLGDVVTDIRLIAQRAQTSPRFTRNAEEFQQILQRLQPNTVTLASHSLGSAVAIFLFNRFPNAPIDRNFMFNPAIVFDELEIQQANQELVQNSVVFRTQQDLVSLGSALSNFKTKTMPLKNKNFVSGHKLNIFEKLMQDSGIRDV